MVDKVAIYSPNPNRMLFFVDPENNLPIDILPVDDGGRYMDSGVVTRDGHIIANNNGYVNVFEISGGRASFVKAFAKSYNTVDVRLWQDKIVLITKDYTSNLVLQVNNYDGDVTPVGSSLYFPNNSYFSDISEGGFAVSATEELIYSYNMLTGTTHPYISWNAWPGKYPQFDEGTENNTAGGDTFRSNQNWLDVDAAGGAISNETGRFYWCGFNESTNLEAVVMGRPRHNMYFASSPMNNLNAWRIDHQAFIPQFGEFPTTYPAFGNGVMMYPWYIYADGGNDRAVLSWNVETNETHAILYSSMLPSAYQSQRYFLCLSGGATLNRPRLRQYPREDGLGANSGPRQRTKTMGTSKQSSIRQGIRNTYT